MINETPIRNDLNGTYNLSTNPPLNAVSVQTTSRTLSPQSNTTDTDGVTPLKHASDIQLTQIDSGRQDEEEKYISNDKETEQCVLSKRRQASIEFYRELFNVDNFDHNGKLLTTKKRARREKKRLKAHKKNRNKKRVAYHYGNDSVNLKAHERSFNDMNDMTEDDDIEIGGANIELKADAHIEMNAQMYDYDSATNIGQILSSKIYDDEEQKAVRFRYRCILYLPPIVFMICGITSLVLHELLDTELYLYVNYAYPVLQIILSIVLWCQIDIVILSCGGAHIVEECLEVQISANGDEYKCIYCCWCNCAVLRFCNSCTHNNGFSLFKCHHTFMKILICCICPLLTIVCFIISEVPQINEPLMMTTMGELYSIQFIYIHDSSSVYWFIFMILAILYLAFLFTATYIGILIVKSLHFVSSLPPKTLSMQYMSSVMITFVMQIQFMVLLVYYNVYNSSITIDIIQNGLCSPTPFFMILIYIEFIVAGFINHFSFQNNDFVRFGRKAIEENEVQLFDFQPDFDCIHDLHNYRRVYGEKFLWQLDHKNVTFLNAPDIDQPPHDHVSIASNHSDDSKNRKIKTPLITDRGVITAEKSKHATKQTSKKRKSGKKHEQIESIELEPVIDDDDQENMNHNVRLVPIKDEKPMDHYETQTTSLSGTMKETKHNHPTTTTTSLSLELNGDTIYSLDLEHETSCSHSDDNVKKKKKGKTSAGSASNVKLQNADSEKP